MKLTATNSRHSHPRRGSVVLVLLIFLTLMLMLCSVTWREVFLTRREVALIEKHQIERLAAVTNTPPVATKSMSTQ